MKQLAALFLILIAYPSLATKVTKPTHITVSSGKFIPAVNDLSQTNWPLAGVPGGIPTTRTQCGSTVSPSGHLTPPVSGDDWTLITAAITACAANGVVQLSAGKFYLSNTQTILLNKSITLRGTGDCSQAAGGEPPVAYCQTELYVYNGMLQTYAAGSACGATAPGLSPCQGSAIHTTIQMGQDPGSNLWWSGCQYGINVTGCGATVVNSVAKGDTTVQVSSQTHFSVGQAIRIDEMSGAITQTNPANTSGSLAANLFGAADYNGAPTNAPTGRIVYGPGDTGVEDGQAYGAQLDRETSEIKQIASMGAGPCPGTNCTLTFDSPLTIAFRAGSPHFAQVYWPTDENGTATPFIKSVGVENLTIERSTNGPITIQYCSGCWVKNVETFLWLGGININNSLRVELNTVYLHDAADLENSGIEYPVAFDGGTAESLLTNSIIRLGGKGMVGRACGGGNVVSYNYVDDTMYQANDIGNYFIDMGVNGSHYVGCHHMLLEGNWGDTGGDDETHGNVTYHTYFRNQFPGQRTPFTDPSISVASSVTFGIASSVVNDNSGLAWSTGEGYPTPPAPMRAVGVMMWDYEMAFAGNVLGISGVTNAAHGYVYEGCYGSAGCPNNTGEIWLLGWSGSECGNGGVYCLDLRITGATAPALLFRNGNYDYFHNSQFDNAGGYSQSFPNSFYLSAPPAFFGASGANCIYAWPWVTPGSSPQTQTPTGAGCTATTGLPAKARYMAGTPFKQP